MRYTHGFLRLIWRVFALGMVWSSFGANAALGQSLDTSLNHHRLTSHALYQWHALEQQKKLPGFWVSYLQSRSSTRWIQDHSDALILQIPRLARSPYAPEIGYDVASFYKPERPRLAFIGNVPIEVPFKGVLSFGLDTGHASHKLDIQPSLFLGISGLKALGSDTHLVVSFGSWIGGDTQEEYCRDETERRFQCATLLPWSERLSLGETTRVSYSGLVELRQRF